MTQRLHPDDLRQLAELVRDAVARALKAPGERADRQSPRIANRNGARGNEPHCSLVARLVAGGTSTEGFRAAVERTLGARFNNAPRFIPDAYYIRHDTKRIGIFEATVSSGLSRRKLDKICAWRDWIAGFGWSLRLMEIDEQGRMIGIDPDVGDMDDESRRRVLDVLHGKIDSR